MAVGDKDGTDSNDEAGGGSGGRNGGGRQSTPRNSRGLGGNGSGNQLNNTNSSGNNASSSTPSQQQPNYKRDAMAVVENVLKQSPRVADDASHSDDRRRGRLQLQEPQQQQLHQ